MSSPVYNCITIGVIAAYCSNFRHFCIFEPRFGGELRTIEQSTWVYSYANSNMRLTRHSSDSTAFEAPVNSSQHGVSVAGQLVIRFWAVTSWPCDELTGTLTNHPRSRPLLSLGIVFFAVDRSVPSAEVVKALWFLVNSVPRHFGPLKKDQSDQGPNWLRTEVDVILRPCKFFWASCSIVLGGVCCSTTAALRIHRLGADNAKNLREWDQHVLAAFEKKWNNQRIDEYT